MTLQVMDQYSMTQEMWEERITSYYAQHKGLPRYMHCVVKLLYSRYPWDSLSVLIEGGSLISRIVLYTSVCM